jgi:FixJ family two-component response regulator
MDARTYASGHDFLAGLRHGGPHCLIVDLNMPEMTGLELLRELVRRGQRIPAVVITGKYDESIRDACRAAGAIACLAKPMKPDRLLAVLDSCLGTFSAPSFASGHR